MSSGIQIYADKENVFQLLLDPNKTKKNDTPRPKLTGNTITGCILPTLTTLCEY